jgi:hypothetical protein
MHVGIASSRSFAAFLRREHLGLCSREFCAYDVDSQGILYHCYLVSAFFCSALIGIVVPIVLQHTCCPSTLNERRDAMKTTTALKRSLPAPHIYQIHCSQSLPSRVLTESLSQPHHAPKPRPTPPRTEYPSYLVVQVVPGAEGNSKCKRWR